MSNFWICIFKVQYNLVNQQALIFYFWNAFPFQSQLNEVDSLNQLGNFMA